MFVRSISVRREGDYGSSWQKVDPTQPFLASIAVEGQNGKVELVLSPDLSRRIVELIAEEVAAAGRATAEAMVAEVFNIPSLPAPAEVQ